MSLKEILEKGKRPEIRKKKVSPSGEIEKAEKITATVLIEEDEALKCDGCGWVMREEEEATLVIALIAPEPVVIGKFCVLCRRKAEEMK